MRLPVHENSGAIDRERSAEMMRYALDRGVNYFDTAWPYHDGESEPFLGEFLEKAGARERVSIATKLPSWLVKGEADLDAFFGRQLERLRTDRIDLYLLHALNDRYWQALKEAKVLDFLDRLKEQGFADKVGFSFHDEFPVFRDVIESYPWDFCQVQYNFLDTGYQAGLEGIKLAAGRGIGVVVMEPLRGGSFTKDVPPDAAEIWREGAGYSPAEWALRYVWDDNRVQVVLSGMSEMSHVVENIRIAEEAEAGSLSIDDLERYDRAALIYEERRKALCSGCGYCMPCPQGVNIPEVFRFLNNAYMFGDREGAAAAYRNNIREEKGAQLCIGCRECEPACPQHLSIAHLMEEAVEVLG
jgi:predicted aldo/keto reductase-like oxidoreductase